MSLKAAISHKSAEQMAAAGDIQAQTCNTQFHAEKASVIAETAREIFGLAQLIPSRPVLPEQKILSFMGKFANPPGDVKWSRSIGGWTHDCEDRGDFSMRLDEDSNTRPPYDRGEYYLRVHVPDKGFDGVIMLDREGKDFQRGFKLGPTTTRWTTDVANMRSLVEWFRTRRPKAPVCAYAFPDNRTRAQNDAWRDAWLAYPFDMFDLLMPSVYKWYQGDNAGEMAKYETAVRFSLELAAAHDLPVYLMVTHRYTGGDKPQGLIPDKEQIEYLEALLNVDFEGKKPAGLAPWSADPFYHAKQQEQYYTQIELERGETEADEYLAVLEQDVYDNCRAALALVS